MLRHIYYVKDKIENCSLNRQISLDRSYIQNSQLSLSCMSDDVLQK